MFNEYCLIRCSSCGESKSIFQPWNPNKYLCMDCFNFYGPVAQLDKASVYGTEDYRLDSYRVRHTYNIFCIVIIDALAKPTHQESLEQETLKKQRRHEGSQTYRRRNIKLN